MTEIELTESTFVIKSVNLRHHLDEHGEPWFVAKDVCDYLELENVSQACSRLFEGTVRVSRVNTGAGSRDMNIVSEPGLYQLIFQSRKPEAAVFQQWLFKELLPTLRKRGYYRLKNRSLGGWAARGDGAGNQKGHGRQPFLDVLRDRRISMKKAFIAMNDLPLDGVPLIRETSYGNQCYGGCRVGEALARRASEWLRLPVEELFTASSRERIV